VKIRKLNHDRLLNYLAFKYFGFECTWLRLFQKCAVFNKIDICVFIHGVQSCSICIFVYAIFILPVYILLYSLHTIITFSVKYRRGVYRMVIWFSSIWCNQCSKKLWISILSGAEMYGRQLCVFAVGLRFP
jgi:hypothetical protein